MSMEILQYLFLCLSLLMAGVGFVQWNNEFIRNLAAAVMLVSLFIALSIGRFCIVENIEACKIDAQYWASQAIVCGRDVEELSAEEVKRCKTLNSELDSLDAYLKSNNCNLYIKGDIQ